MEMQFEDLHRLVDLLETPNQQIAAQEFLKYLIRQDDNTPLNRRNSISEHLKLAGILSPERAKEMMEEIKKSREEWN